MAAVFNETEINGELRLVDSAAEVSAASNDYNGLWQAENIQHNGRSSALGFPRYQSPTVTLLQKSRGEMS